MRPAVEELCAPKAIGHSSWGRVEGAGNKRSNAMKMGYAGSVGGVADPVSTLGQGALAGLGAAGLASAAWSRACVALKGEMGDDTFGSWLARRSLCEDQAGELVLVTPTGIARDWVRRNAWRRITELWGQNDPMGRPLGLQSKVEFEGCARPVAGSLPTRPRPLPWRLQRGPKPWSILRGRRPWPRRRSACIRSGPRAFASASPSTLSWPAQPTNSPTPWPGAWRPGATAISIRWCFTVPMASAKPI